MAYTHEQIQRVPADVLCEENSEACGCASRARLRGEIDYWKKKIQRVEAIADGLPSTPLGQVIYDQIIEVLRDE